MPKQKRCFAHVVRQLDIFDIPGVAGDISPLTTPTPKDGANIHGTPEIMQTDALDMPESAGIIHAEPIDYPDSPAQLPFAPITTVPTPAGFKPATSYDIEGNGWMLAFHTAVREFCPEYIDRITDKNGKICARKTMRAVNGILGANGTVPGRVASDKPTPTAEEWEAAMLAIATEVGSEDTRVENALKALPVEGGAK